MDSTPLCDRYITEGWYRAKSHVMSSSPPILGKCNTLYPVWLKGILFVCFSFLWLHDTSALDKMFLKSGFIIKLHLFFLKACMFFVFYDDISYNVCQMLNEYWPPKQHAWPVNILEILYLSIWMLFCGVFFFNYYFFNI